MKKIISGLLAGLVATSFTMTTMAAPVQDYQYPPAKHHIDKKLQPLKHDFRKGSDHKALFKHNVNNGHPQIIKTQIDINKIKSQ